MVTWTVILIILLVIVVYLLLLKLYNEHKIKNGRNSLAGKVALKLNLEFLFYFITN